MAGCGLIFPEDETTSTSTLPTIVLEETREETLVEAPLAPLPAVVSVVGGETAGQDWEGFAHVVDNSSQTGSMIQSFSIGNASSVTAVLSRVLCIGFACYQQNSNQKTLPLE